MYLFLQETKTELLRNLPSKKISEPTVVENNKAYL